MVEGSLEEVWMKISAAAYTIASAAVGFALIMLSSVFGVHASILSITGITIAFGLFAFVAWHSQRLSTYMLLVPLYFGASALTSLVKGMPERWETAMWYILLLSFGVIVVLILPRIGRRFLNT